MDMTIIKSEKRLCTCCMEEHIVKTVILKEHTIFKNQNVSYDATYFYCDNANEYYMDEEQIQINDINMKDAYRKTQGLLTSKEINNIRRKYSISQSDLCALLGWGGKTITRYESHQVQDKAHDSILRKLDNDPEWFIYLLKENKSYFTEDLYSKYLKKATDLYESDKDMYLRKAIEASYAPYHGKNDFNGNTDLSLDKVVDVIRYFASNIKNLYKVKLMKLMWYADAFSYKERGFAITGLVYKALPMGAVPIEHNSIIDLKNVPCEEVEMGETIAYRFCISGVNDFPSLSPDDIEILDRIIKKLGKMTKDEIVSFMHKEDAYIKTAEFDVIKFKYVKSLRI